MEKGTTEFYEFKNSDPDLSRIMSEAFDGAISSEKPATLSLQIKPSLGIAGVDSLGFVAIAGIVTVGSLGLFIP